MYSFCAMYSFRMSFCSVPESVFQSAPCFSATARYMAQITAAGELMVIEVVTLAERNLVEERFHVGERTDRHAAFADFAFGERVVGVVAHQRGQIESHRKAGLPLREQVAEARVGIARACRSRRTAAWSTAARDTSMDECRACREARRARRGRAPDPNRRDRLRCRGGESDSRKRW